MYERIIRWIRIVSMVLALLAVVTALIGLWMSPGPRSAGMGTRMITIGLASLIISIAMALVPAIDRVWRRMAGKPVPRQLQREAAAYTCPTCGYRLRGVTGVFCPECGTVRPAPIDGEDAMD